MPTTAYLLKKSLQRVSQFLGQRAIARPKKHQGSGLQKRLSRRLLREWATLFFAICLTTFAFEFASPLERLNQGMYDVFLKVLQRSPNPNIVIIAIDDPSLSLLGRWPWSRHIHALMLDKLAQYHPKAVALDLIFNEPESIEADTALASSMTKFQHIFLPIAPNTVATETDPVKAMKPLDIFDRSVTGTGHIGVSLDNDSIVRNIWLYEGDYTQMWPHLMWRLYQSLHPKAKMPRPTRDIAVNIMGWERSGRFLIPYRSAPYKYPMVSYTQILSGSLSPDLFKDKYVLIGVTSQSLNDSYSTPNSGNSTPMPGVELHANILNAFLTHTAYRLASPALKVILPLIFFAVLFYHLIFSNPSFNLSLAIALILSTLFIAFFLLSKAYIWWSPVTTLLGIAVAYPLWSWRRLETAIDYMGQEAKLLENEPNLLPETVLLKDEKPTIDIVGGHIEVLNQSIERVRNLRRFIYFSLQSLPDAAVVTDPDGYILVTNELAREFFNALHIPTLHGTQLPLILTELADHNKIRLSEVNTDKSFSWNMLLSIGIQKATDAKTSYSVEAVDTEGRDWLIKVSACRDGDHIIIGWIVSFIDLTDMRAAQNQRDEMLRFLSHDMRAPQSSILALLEYKKANPNAKDDQQLFDQIENYTKRALELSDGFAQYARAESSGYNFQEINCQDVLQDAIDQIWPLAQKKNIKVVTDFYEDGLYVSGDRDLLTRAFINIIHNAIKYSPEGTTVTCKIDASPLSAVSDHYCADVFIIDQGVGISEDDQQRLFQRYQRSKDHSKARIDGVGLGLAFVKLVVEKHYGTIHVHSKANQGSIFEIRIPLVEETSHVEFN